MNYSDLVMELSAAPGPSGSEASARAVIERELAPFVDEIKTDVMGNLIAVKRCGKENAGSIMLDAHMDEIGLIITGYEKGFLRFGTLGGIDPRMLPAGEVRILAPEPIFGVIDVMPPHALSKEEMDNSLPMDKLLIDIGMNQEQAQAAVPVGTPAVYVNTPQRLGEDMLCGKAFDDRACVGIVIKAMEALGNATHDLDIYCLISTQEELGYRGAIAGAFGIHPDYAIALDVTHGATPDAPAYKTMQVGKGAAIGVGPNFNRHLTDAIIQTAKDKALDYQLEAVPGCSGTDAWPIQIGRGGVATALISLPLKYMHSPIETMKLSDGENIIELLTAFLRRAGEVLGNA